MEFEEEFLIPSHAIKLMLATKSSMQYFNLST